MAHTLPILEMKNAHIIALSTYITVSKERNCLLNRHTSSISKANIRFLLCYVIVNIERMEPGLIVK